MLVAMFMSKVHVLTTGVVIVVNITLQLTVNLSLLTQQVQSFFKVQTQAIRILRVQAYFLGVEMVPILLEDQEAIFQFLLVQVLVVRKIFCLISL